MPRPLRQPKDRISLLVVTADNMTSELIQSAFAHGRNGFAVKTMTGMSQEIIERLPTNKADVALISEELQDGPQAGVKVLERLHDSNQTPAVMLLRSSKPEGVVNAFRVGARGVFYRAHSLKALSKCIRMVHKGQIWASNEDLGHLIKALARSKPPQFNDPDGMPLLTSREKEVVQFVVDGLKNREIAEKLNVKEHSVRNYLYRIFEKLGISTRVELLLYYFSRGKSD